MTSLAPRMSPTLPWLTAPYPALHRARAPQKLRSPPYRASRLLRSLSPGSVAEVAKWAETSFQEVLNTQPELNLAKACMLIALEEEAAAQAVYLASEGFLDGQTPMPRSATSASTWSLERLEALAAQCAQLFFARCQAMGVADELQLAVQSGASDDELLALHGALVRGFPMALLDAVNEVVFMHQGYTRMAAHGDPWDSTLSAVLETGRGSPAALAVLYREVCARLGLALHAAVLEGGRYLVLWPADAAVQLAAGGERFVIDPYAGGELYSQEEVCMLFGLDEEGQCAGLVPATGRQILAALLQGLQDSHWSRSLGCAPEPALMVPPSLDLALGGSSQDQPPLPSSASTGSGSQPSQQPHQQQPQAQQAQLAQQEAAKMGEAQEQPACSGLSSEDDAGGNSGYEGDSEGPASQNIPGSNAATSSCDGRPTAASSSVDSGSGSSGSGSSSGSSGSSIDAGQPSSGHWARGGRRRRQQQEPSQGHHLERAVAAASKRAHLLPQSWPVRLQYALLLYFSRRYRAALQELEALLQPAIAAPPVPLTGHGSGLAAAAKERAAAAAHAAAGSLGKALQRRQGKCTWEECGVAVGQGSEGMAAAQAQRERLELLREKCRLLACQ